MLFDGLDGRVARLTHTESAFGKEYDSLADMVAFGVAPALVSYQWGVARITEYGRAWGRLGWLAAFFYAVMAALRLARFNTRVGTADKRYFEGLPSPSAAAVVSGFIWASTEWREPGLPGLVIAFTVTALAGALMVSPFSYPSFKNFDLTQAGEIRLAGHGGAGDSWSSPAIRRARCCCVSAATRFGRPLAWTWRRLRRTPARRPRRNLKRWPRDSARQGQYLQALGVDRWVARRPAAERRGGPRRRALGAAGAPK